MFSRRAFYFLILEFGKIKDSLQTLFSDEQISYDSDLPLPLTL